MLELIKLLGSKKLVVEISLVDLEVEEEDEGQILSPEREHAVKEMMSSTPNQIAEAVGVKGLPEDHPAANKPLVPRNKDEFVDSVINNWNIFADWANSDGGFPSKVAKVRMSNQTIRRRIAARFKEPAWQDGYWLPMLSKLETLRSHYRGENGWVITLNYLVRNDGQAEALLAGEWSEEAPKSTEVTKDDIAEGLAAMKKMEEEAPW